MTSHLPACKHAGQEPRHNHKEYKHEHCDHKKSEGLPDRGANDLPQALADTSAAIWLGGLDTDGANSQQDDGDEARDDHPQWPADAPNADSRGHVFP